MTTWRPKWWFLYSKLNNHLVKPPSQPKFSFFISFENDTELYLDISYAWLPGLAGDRSRFFIITVIIISVGLWEILKKLLFFITTRSLNHTRWSSIRKVTDLEVNWGQCQLRIHYSCSVVFWPETFWWYWKVFSEVNFHLDFPFTKSYSRLTLRFSFTLSWPSSQSLAKRLTICYDLIILW